MKLSDQTLCIVGLGLMGGSVAKALSGKVKRLHAVDPDAPTRDKALSRRVVDLATESLHEGITGAQIIVLAAPVRANLAALEQLGELLPSGTLVIDLSSTKAAVVEAMAALPEGILAVGGHPMCGKERSGVDHSDASLFSQRIFVLCDCARTSDAARELATSLIRALNAIPLTMKAVDHDRMVARLSHLPYLLSAALVESCAQLPPPAPTLAATGFRDTSRLAASDPEMMVDVLLTNSGEIRQAIVTARQKLDELAELIAAAEVNALRERLAEVQSLRHQWEESAQVDSNG